MKARKSCRFGGSNSKGYVRSIVGEPDSHRARTTGEPDAHRERARRTLHAHYGKARHASRAHRMGIARALDLADSHHDAYAQHRGAMPCAPRGISHRRNAMARCYEAGLDKGKQATSPSHGHLDMARAHTSMWGRHTDAPDAWSDGWCTLPSSEALIEDMLMGTCWLRDDGWCKWWHVQATIWVEGRLAKEGSLAPRTHEKFSELQGVTIGSSSGPETPSKVRVPELKGFNINRNVKELENFLWDIEQFFKDGRRCKVGNAPNHHVGDSEEGIEGSFLFHQHCMVVREALEKVQAHGSVREYVKEFSSLMLDIKNMSEEDKLFNSCRDCKGGLRPNLGDKGGKPVEKTTKVCSRPPGWQDASSAMALIEPVKALVDSGATHNFVATRETTRLGLKLEEDTSRIKAINSKPKRSKG
ncbi:hypothetical protein CK203_112377 [Vitis vinifera]|uniref:Retrotransposon gag domain-containing protein n=1 Tax=Vitis vinifera TaxID=29760 RepID=A0A438C8P2_VITVI|nr:hypothetical protein CK203_112377 [Vitis vinifera]